MNGTLPVAFVTPDCGEVSVDSSLVLMSQFSSAPPYPPAHIAGAYTAWQAKYPLAGRRAEGPTCGNAAGHHCREQVSTYTRPGSLCAGELEDQGILKRWPARAPSALARDEYLRSVSAPACPGRVFTEVPGTHETGSYRVAFVPFRELAPADATT
jgi:predicted RNA-binding Zn-ribbon protein involved in translation (DUF1610 family)